MAVVIEFIGSIAPVINIRLPIPLMVEDHVSFGYNTDKEGSDMLMNLLITYEIENALDGGRYIVTRYRCSFKIKIDTEPLTAERLYPIPQSAIQALNNFLHFYTLSHNIPEQRIPCPPLSHLQKELQQQINKFLAL